MNPGMNLTCASRRESQASVSSNARKPQLSTPDYLPCLHFRLQ